MALIALHPLPAHDRLRREGFEVHDPDPSGRPFRVGLLNMMADAALEATERQILRLLARGVPHVDLALVPFTLTEIPRSPKGADHVGRYPSFEEVRRDGLDALFVTGANVPDPDLERLPFRDALVDALAWIRSEVPSTLYSCLATHAVLGFVHGEPRRALAGKCWGVFPHEVHDPAHALVRGLSRSPVVPHSRWNDVSRAQFERAGLTVLMTTEEGGVHLAVGGGDRQEIYWQGHPEYDPVSLLKEYKREVGRFVAGELEQYPETPAAMTDRDGTTMLDAHRREVAEALESGVEPPPFPEHAVEPHLDDSWCTDTVTMVGNWIGGLVGGPERST